MMFLTFQMGKEGHNRTCSTLIEGALGTESREDSCYEEKSLLEKGIIPNAPCDCPEGEHWTE
jgi:hypothetical protein